jgi:hypothetical protein
MQRDHARTDAATKATASRKPHVDAFDPHFPRRSHIARQTPETACSQSLAYDPHFRPMSKR